MIDPLKVIQRNHTNSHQVKTTSDHVFDTEKHRPEHREVQREKRENLSRENSEMRVQCDERWENPSSDEDEPLNAEICGNTSRRMREIGGEINIKRKFLTWRLGILPETSVVTRCRV